MRKRIGESTSVDFEGMIGKRVKFFTNSVVTDPAWEGDVTYTSWTGSQLLVSAKDCVTYKLGGAVRENSRKIRKSSPMSRRIWYEIINEFELTTTRIEARHIKIGDEISADVVTPVRGIVTSIKNENYGRRTLQFQPGYVVNDGEGFQNDGEGFQNEYWAEGGQYRYNVLEETPVTLYTSAPQPSKETVDRDAMLKAYFKQKVAEKQYGGGYNLMESHPIFQAFVDTFKELTE